MRLIIFIWFVITTLTVYGQSERQYIRSGNKLYEEKKYADAELSYRKALDKKPKSFESSFNIGNALYKEGKFMDAATQFGALTEATTDKEKLAKVYHNLGNSYLKAEKLNESIDAYKKALLNNPNDKETKFNLAYAQKLIQKKQNENNSDPNDVKPSEYANQIKKQADELVAKRLYGQAYKLMQDLMAKDKTAIAFQDYIKRLKDVVEVNTI